MWFVQLLAYGLASTLVVYALGALLIYKLRLTIATKIVGRSRYRGGKTKTLQIC